MNFFNSDFTFDYFIILKIQYTWYASLNVLSFDLNRKKIKIKMFLQFKWWEIIVLQTSKVMTLSSFDSIIEYDTGACGLLVAKSETRDMEYKFG